MTRSRWSYSRWDGTQVGITDDIDSLFDEIADDLLYHGDPDAALRRMLNSGFRRPGEQVQGLHDLMSRLRQRRQEELDRYDLGGPYREIAEELEQVLAEERAGLEELADDARASGDERRKQVTDEVVAERHMQLELLPQDLAGRVKGLQEYEFSSSQAREHFEELMERLREQVAKSWFDQMSEALTNPDPEHLEKVRQALDALNRMIEQKEAGEPIDPSFEQFMEQFGDMFPGNPQSLDELLEQLAAQMAAVQAALDSMGPEQRAQLQALAQSLFEDMDLRWQVDRLAGNLQKAVPGAGWGRRYRFSGDQPVGLDEATSSARRLGEMDQLEQFLKSAASPGALAEVDLDQARQYLGEDGARSLQRLANLAREARGSRTDQQARGPLRADRQGDSPDRAESSRSCSPSSPRTGPRATAPRSWEPVTNVRVRPSRRIRRPVHLAYRAHRSQRGTKVGVGNAGAPATRRLRDRTHRGSRQVFDRADGRPLAVDADA